MKKFISKNQKLSQFAFILVIMLAAIPLNIAILNLVLNGGNFENYVTPSHVNPFSSFAFFWAGMFFVVMKVGFELFDMNTKEKKYDYLMMSGIPIGLFFLVLGSLYNL